MYTFRLIGFGVTLSGILMMTLCSTTSADAKQCSAERPAHPKSYWSYRLIDGRKCWYEGKPMLSKSLLHWPASATSQAASGKSTISEKSTVSDKSTVAPAGQRSLLDAQASISAVPANRLKPDIKREMADATPVAAAERSLTPDHLRAWANGMAAITAEPILTIIDRWPDADLPQHKREAAPAEASSLTPPRIMLMMTILLMALGAVLISVNFHRRALPET